MLRSKDRNGNKISIDNIRTKKNADLDSEMKRLRDNDGTYKTALSLLLDNSLMYEIGSEEIPSDRCFKKAVMEYNRKTPLTPYSTIMNDSIVIVTKYILEYLTTTVLLTYQKKTNKSANSIDNYPELFDDACKNYEEFIIQPNYSDSRIIVACTTLAGNITSMASVLITSNNTQLSKINPMIEDIIRNDISKLTRTTVLKDYHKIVFEFEINESNSSDKIVSIKKTYKQDVNEPTKFPDKLHRLMLKNAVVYDDIFNISYTRTYIDILEYNNEKNLNHIFKIINISPMINVSTECDKLPVTSYKYHKFIMLVRSNDIVNSDKHYISELLPPALLEKSNASSNEVLFDISHRKFFERPEHMFKATVKNILLNSNYNNGVNLIIIVEQIAKGGMRKEEVKLYINDKYSMYKILFGYITIGTLVHYSKGGEKGKKNTKGRRYRFCGNHEMLDVNLLEIRSLNNFNIFATNLANKDIRRRYNLDPELDQSSLNKLMETINSESSLDIGSKLELGKNIFNKSQYCDLLRVLDELDPELLLISKHAFINAVWQFRDPQSINKIIASIVLGKLYSSFLINKRLYNLLTSVILYSNVNVCNIINAVYSISKYDITEKLNLQRIHKFLIIKHGLSLVDQVLGFETIINELMQEDSSKMVDILSEESNSLLDDVLAITAEPLFITNFLQLTALIKEK